LASNPNGLHLLLDFDYEKMSNNNKFFNEELIEFIWHPKRMERMSKKYDMDLDEYIEFLEKCNVI